MIPTQTENTYLRLVLLCLDSGITNYQDVRAVSRSYSHPKSALLLSRAVITLSRCDEEIESGMYKLSSKLRVSRYKYTLRYILLFGV